MQARPQKCPLILWRTKQGQQCHTLLFLVFELYISLCVHIAIGYFMNVILIRLVKKQSNISEGLCSRFSKLNLILCLIKSVGCECLQLAMLIQAGLSSLYAVTIVLNTLVSLDSAPYGFLPPVWPPGSFAIINSATQIPVLLWDVRPLSFIFRASRRNIGVGLEWKNLPEITENSYKLDCTGQGSFGRTFKSNQSWLQVCSTQLSSGGGVRLGSNPMKSATQRLVCTCYRVHHVSQRHNLSFLNVC